MYRQHFNLNDNPFSIAPDPRYLYMSDKHREALAHLMYGLGTDGGFVLLTGEVGTGKTTVCRCLLEQLPEDVDVAFVLNPKLTASELLATICDELHIEYDRAGSTNKELIDGITRQLLEAHAAGRKTVLIVDEAQNLDPEVLEQVRLLTNLETNQRKLLQIIMLGQPELRDQLARPELRQLSQRITARYHLGPLDRRDIAPYINHRLAIAGHHKKLFPDRLVNRIYSLTNGIPRLINVVCDRALLGLYVEGGETVSPPVLKKAALEVLGRDDRTSRMFRWLIPALFALCLAATLFFTLPSDRPGKEVRPTGETTASSSAPRHSANPAELAWPGDLPRSRSLEMAQTAIFAAWGKVYRPGDPADPCAQAEEAGLACLPRQGSLGSLKRLDRPAVLRLTARDGREFYGVLAGLKDDQATLLIGTDKVRTSTATLEEHWNGTYTILWQPPPGYTGPVRQDSGDGTAAWLAEKLELTTGLSSSEYPLGQLITVYQQREGLVADGIAGPDTLIHLNSSIGRSGPDLMEND